MDLNALLVLSILGAFSSVPFIYMYKVKRKQQNLMLGKLTEMASRQQGSITHHECCSDFIIGLDENKGVVYFYKEFKGTEETQVVDLSFIQDCKVEKISKSTSQKGSSYAAIENVFLKLTPLDKHASATRIPFFIGEERLQLSTELEAANKWAKIVNDQISLRSKSPRSKVLAER